MNADLEQLLSLPNVWQASRIRRITSVISTGYDQLDEHLHDRGWPDSATTELLLPHVGIGELRLLIPALRQVQQRRPWLVFIAPPYQPYAAALAQQSINPSGVLVIYPRSEKDLLWCAEQVLRSGCCGAVVTWAMSSQLNHHQLRRLQQAAHRGQCWHTLLRHPHSAGQASPSALRLQLDSRATNGLLDIHVVKQRGGRSGQSVQLQLSPDLAQLQQLGVEQLPLPVAQATYRPLSPRIASQVSPRVPTQSHDHANTVVSLPLRKR